MGYVGLAPHFCATTEAVKYIVKNTMHERKYDPYHPLEVIPDTPPKKDNYTAWEVVTIVEKEWKSISLQTQKVSLAHVEVYLDNFIEFF